MTGLTAGHIERLRDLLARATQHNRTDEGAALEAAIEGLVASAAVDDDLLEIMERDGVQAAQWRASQGEHDIGKAVRSDEVRATVAALRAGAPKVGGGWVVVPVEPTVVMLEAGCVNRKGPRPHQTYTASEVAEIYADMVGAAPKYRGLSTPSGAGDAWTARVATLAASNGTTHVVSLDGPHGTVTPHEYGEKWKAEYDVACWNQFFIGGPEPDILAFGPVGT